MTKVSKKIVRKKASSKSRTAPHISMEVRMQKLLDEGADAVRISAGGAIKITRKIGDDYVGVEAMASISAPSTLKHFEEDQREIAKRARKMILEDLDAKSKTIEKAYS